VTSPKLALVLSGGGMGGAAHIGAIKALEEYGLIPEAVLGTSIGAFVGSVYASGATPQQLIDGWKAISDRNLGTLLDLDGNALRQAVTRFDHRYITGFILGQTLMQVQLDNYVHVRTFDELARLSPAERRAKNVKAFYAVSANLLDGRETVFCAPDGLELDANGLYEGRRLCHHVSFVQAVRASFSLPAIFTPYRIDIPDQPCPCQTRLHPHSPGYHLYVDGAIKDDYPITIAAKVAKADKIIGINLTQAGANVNLALNGGLPDIQSRILKIIGEDQFEADRADKDVARVDLLTIDPAIGDVAMFDMSMGDWLIERGYQAVKQCFEQKGLSPTYTREENLARLFVPQVVDLCPDCGQQLPTPRDLGTDELFVPQLPAYLPQPQAKKAGLVKQLLERLTGGRPVSVLLGLLALFVIGLGHSWWVYTLAQNTGSISLTFLAGALLFTIIVLLTALFIGSWVIRLIQNFSSPAPLSEKQSLR
jgi:NTE family protein